MTARPLSVSLEGPVFVFLWSVTGRAHAPGGEAIDLLGELRAALRKPVSIAVAASKQEGWSTRRYPFAFPGPDHVVMAWSLVNTLKAEGGEQVDAAYALRNALRPLWRRVEEGD